MRCSPPTAAVQSRVRWSARRRSSAARAAIWERRATDGRTSKTASSTRPTARPRTGTWSRLPRPPSPASPGASSSPSRSDSVARRTRRWRPRGRRCPRDSARRGAPTRAGGTGISPADTAGANRAVDYLFGTQQKPDGSFPQNSTVDGTPHWGNLQLDEVALPIVLAWQLGRTDSTLYRDHIKKAADFVVQNGPYSPQE